MPITTQSLQTIGCVDSVFTGFSVPSLGSSPWMDMLGRTLSSLLSEALTYLTGLHEPRQLIIKSACRASLASQVNFWAIKSHGMVSLPKDRIVALRKSNRHRFPAGAYPGHRYTIIFEIMEPRILLMTSTACTVGHPGCDTHMLCTFRPLGAPPCPLFVFALCPP